MFGRTSCPNCGMHHVSIYFHTDNNVINYKCECCDLRWIHTEEDERIRNKPSLFKKLVEGTPLEKMADLCWLFCNNDPIWFNNPPPINIAPRKKT